MAYSLNINDLTKVEVEKRDLEWEKAFLASFPSSRLQLISDTPQAGPDGWPYLLVATAEGAGEPADKVLMWLAERGIGMAINPQKDVPDFVLSYGMIWNYRERREFISQAVERRNGQIKFEQGLKVHSGPPSEEFIPDYVRKILRSFFKDQGIEQVPVLVMGTKDTNYDLCFSLEGIGSPPAVEHRGVLEAISWFFPAHYSLMLVSEKGLPPFSTL